MTDYTEAGQPIVLRPHWQQEIVKCTVTCVLQQRYYLTVEKYAEAERKRRQRGQAFALAFLVRFDEVLQDPDVVEVDPQWADGKTRLYFRRLSGLTDGSGHPCWLAVATQLGAPNFIWTLYPAREGELMTWQGRPGQILYRR